MAVFFSFFTLFYLRLTYEKNNNVGNMSLVQFSSIFSHK